MTEVEECRVAVVNVDGFSLGFKDQCNTVENKGEKEVEGWVDGMEVFGGGGGG